MKQIIEYYYGIVIENYIKDNDAHVFIYNNELFYFVLYERAKDELYEIIQLSKELKQHRVGCHDLIFNRFNKVVTIFNNRECVLLRVRRDYSEEISSLDMFKINSNLLISDKKRNSYKNNWKELWKSKIDYFENQIRDYGKEKRSILNTFSYYIGLAENAIQYIEVVNQKYFYTILDRLTFCHRRIFYPNYKLNYLNPLSFIIDLEVRDYAEYFKATFFGGDDIKSEFVSLLKVNKMSSYSYNMLFARLLFPTYYFDVYEKIIHNEIKEDKLIEILNYRVKYEEFLKFAYNEIKKYTSMPTIPWLNITIN